MSDLDWKNIRTHNKSQNNAFEEIVCQLAYHIEHKFIRNFHRLGTPDGGVECFWELEDGTEYAWQAKYVFDADNLCSQAEDSFKSALVSHPNISKYYVSFPINLPDGHVKTGKSGRPPKSGYNKWEDKKKSLICWASENGRTVEIIDWNESVLNDILIRPKNEGMRYYWFNKEEFTLSWFNEKFTAVINDLGPRFTPDFNVPLDIANKFEFLAKTKLSIDQVKKLSLRFTKTLNFFLRKTNFRDSYKNIFLKHINICDLIMNSDILNSRLMEVNKLIADLDINEKIMLKLQNNMKKNNDISVIESSEFEEFRNCFYDYDHYLHNDEMKLINYPYMLLYGEPGIGKSHLIADICTTKLKQNIPTILLIGDYFNTLIDPRTQIIQNLQITVTFNVLLQILNSIAESKQERFIFAIDAINEGTGNQLWHKFLSGLINEISGYSWLSLILSIRKDFIDTVWPQNLDNKVIKVEHKGFMGIEYDASQAFFKHYGITSSFPILTPEFSNPLYLKIFCENEIGGELNEAPSILSVFTKYVSRINHQLSLPEKFNFEEFLCPVLKVISSISEEMLCNDKRQLEYQTALTIVNTAIKDVVFVISTVACRNFLDALIKEALFRRYKTMDKNYISFAYDRMADYFHIKTILSHKKDKDDIKKYIAETTYFSNALSSGHPYNILNMLAIVLPIEYHIELIDLNKNKTLPKYIIDAWFESFVWREKNSFNDNIQDRLYSLAEKNPNTEIINMIIESCLPLSAVSDHPLNIKFLNDRFLFKQTMAERDSWWTPFINKCYSSKSDVVLRIINYNKQIDAVYNLSIESRKLMGITLSWFFTASNKLLRDSATKAMSILLINNLNCIFDILKNFEKVSEPYIHERIYASIYGAVLRSQNFQGLRDVAIYIYNNLFLDKEVYPNILTRDYARNIILNAINNSLCDLDIKCITPPYNSPWYDCIPSNEDIDKYKIADKATKETNFLYSQDRIISSMVTEYGRGICGYGDFGRYVFEHAIRAWNEYFDPQELANIATKRVFDMGYNVNLHGKFDAESSQFQSERIGKKYQWIAMYECLAKLIDNYPMSKFEGYDEPMQSNHLRLFLKQFDDNSTEIDEAMIKEETQAPEKTERKKVYKTLPPYQGPWEPSVRNIDPTVLISKLPEGTNLFKNIINVPEFLNVKWTNDFDDIERAINNILILEENEYIALGGFFNWKSDNKYQEDHYTNYSKPINQIDIKITAFIVPKNKAKDCSVFKNIHIYTHEGEWPLFYHMFAFEHFNSICSNDLIDFNYYEDEFEEKINNDLKVCVCSYLLESPTDLSIEDSIHFLMPSKYIVDNLQLKQDSEGVWSSYDGCTCFDTRVKGNEENLLIINKIMLNNFLSVNNLAIVWDLFVEKESQTEAHQWRAFVYVENNEIKCEIYQQDRFKYKK